MELMNIRLFPKHKGADTYCLTGLAARCDWAVLSDYNEPHSELRTQNQCTTPKSIFLSLRAAQFALPYMTNSVLPKISEPFTLVSGSEDITLPHQTDLRWPSFNRSCRDAIKSILESPYLKSWYAENLDHYADPKMKPIPTGMVFPDPEANRTLEPPVFRPAKEKQLKMLCGHRVRQGPQWEIRRIVSELCSKEWAPFTTLLSNELEEPDFVSLMDTHAFTLCVQGGGLDPSPKAWQAMLQGSIPIMRRSPTTDAYRDFPVVIVDDWTPDEINEKKLQNWHHTLAPIHDTPGLRAELLNKLTLDHWWRKIVE